MKKDSTHVVTVPVIVIVMMVTMRVRVMFGNVRIVHKVKSWRDRAPKDYWAQQPIGRFGT